MRKIASVLAVLLVFVASIAIAQPGGRGGKWMGRTMDRHAKLMSDLKLTEKQQEQVKKLRLDLERNQTGLQSKIRLARIDIKEIYMSDKPDRGALEKLVKQVSDYQYQEKMNRIGFWFSVDALLTPEQQKIWKEHFMRMGGEGRREFGPPMRHRQPMMHGNMMRQGPPQNDAE